jgi:hypothetical protein
MKILIVVLSHLDGGIYTKFFETQNESWNSIEVEGVDTFFMVGNNNEDTIDGNLIKTNVRESLYNCGHKTIKAFELLRNYEYDYIFRTNSSSYVDKQMLKDFLQDKPRTNFYSGVIGNHHGILFASGSGFIVSKNVVDLVLLKKEYWEHRFIDDVALGLLLRNLRINPALAPRYDVETVNEKTPMNYYHYRIKTFNRDNDCQFMKSIFELKKLSYK